MVGSLVSLLTEQSLFATVITAKRIAEHISKFEQDEL